jgi:hypothetical protein
MCHSGFDPESGLFNWIPGGVYPVLVGATLRGDPHWDTGRE